MGQTWLSKRQSVVVEALGMSAALSKTTRELGLHLTCVLSCTHLVPCPVHVCASACAPCPSLHDLACHHSLTPYHPSLTPSPSLKVMTLTTSSQRRAASSCARRGRRWLLACA